MPQPQIPVKDRQRSRPRTPLEAGWMRWLLFLAMAGYLLFAHGCHTDKDTELLVRFVTFDSGW
jgi:hypothetical protein